MKLLTITAAIGLLQLSIFTVSNADPATVPSQMSAMAMTMPSSVSVTDPMSREGSGTSWLPDATPTYAKMWMERNGNSFMLHGAMMPRYTDVGSNRGDRRIDAPNWFMGMFTHPLTSTSQLGLHAMMSLDPITEGGWGYPLLYQTGETWHGLPLHDRQHPHNLVAELSATYSKDIGGRRSAYLYLGYPGEPALGPPAYMHRLIASDLADAPIGHHWQDGTHITFGVATLGLDLTHSFKVEASSFTGREPGENRYDFEKPRFDSASTRLSWNPDARDALAISYGYVKNPEGDGVAQHRQTASWIYDNPQGPDANITTTVSWGQNDVASGVGMGVSNSYLEELDYQNGRNTLFSRLEQIQKSGVELSLPSPYANNQLYWLGEYTFGYIRDITHGKGLDTGIGAAISVDPHPTSLNPFYGGQMPVSFQVFLRLRASRMKTDMSGMDMSNPPTGPTVPATTPIVPTTPTYEPEPITPSAQSTPETNQPMPLPTAPTSTLAPPAIIQHVKPGSSVLVTNVALSPDPAEAGKVETLTVTLVKNGKPVIGAKLTADVAMTDMDMGTTHPVFTMIAPGKYTATPVFTMSGNWKVIVHARVPGQSPVTATVTTTAGY